MKMGWRLVRRVAGTVGVEEVEDVARDGKGARPGSPGARVRVLVKST